MSCVAAIEADAFSAVTSVAALFICKEGYRKSVSMDFSTGKKRIALLIISAVMLVLGLLLYLLFNKDAYVSKFLLKIIPIKTITGGGLAIEIIRGYGADLLWSFSFTMIIQFIVWADKKKTILLVFCSLLGIVYELMQRFGITTGTADITDVIVYLLGSLLAIATILGGKFYEENSDSCSSNDG